MRTGLLAEFRTPEEMVHALSELRRRGYRRLDAFSPYPVKGADEALQLPRSRLGWPLFPVALGAAGLGYIVQWYCDAYDYPLNVGGRPLHSAPMFIPITFETGVLITSLVAFLGFVVVSGLPRLYSPLFDVDGFERATIDRFWVGVDDRDPAFDVSQTERDFRDVGATSIRRARGRTW